MARCCHDLRLEADPEAERVTATLDRCKHRLCPFCAAARSAHIAAQVRAAMITYARPRTIVLTQKSTQEPLATQLRKLRTRFHKLRSLAYWKNKVTAGVYVIEVTRNETTGLWHPHMHIIYAGGYLPFQELKTQWQKVCGDSDVVSISEVNDKTKAAYELAKYVGKPAAVAEWPDRSITEYADAIHHTRLLGSFGKRPASKLEDKHPDEHPTNPSISVSLTYLTHLANYGHRTPTAILYHASALWPMVRNWTARHFEMMDLPDVAETDQEKATHRAHLIQHLKAFEANGPPPEQWQSTLATG
jgi:hypothetical protein